MNNPIGKIEGEDLTNIFVEQFSLHSNHISNILSQFDKTDTFNKWHNILLSIEEFINIPLNEIGDTNDLETILSTPLDIGSIGSEHFRKTIEIIQHNFNENVVRRFINLFTMTMAINLSFKVHGIHLFNTGEDHSDTIGGAVIYYQSRRRYFSTILYLIPHISNGIKKSLELDLLNEFLPIIELHCIPVTSINNQQILQKLYNDFYVISDGNKLTGNYHYQPLDELFLEPERISIVDQMTFRNEQINQLDLLSVPKNKVFSISELKNSILLIESAYLFYEIQDSDFQIFKEVIFLLLENSIDDYFISIAKEDFQKIISNYSNSQQTKIYNYLLNNTKDYFENLNSFHPLIELNSTYISNVNLLMRFLYYFKNVFLNRKKRFQIHSGFVFEDIVKNELSRFGFDVTDIKRINRKEFDVVTIKNGIIYNFQCKNNLVDLTNIISSQKKFIRYNRYLVNYYNKALYKEELREALLKNELKLKTIKHFVISRFPIITNNTRVISFNNLTGWITDNFSTQ